MKNIKNSFVPGHNVLKSPKLCYFVLLRFHSLPLGSFLMVLGAFLSNVFLDANLLFFFPLENSCSSIIRLSVPLITSLLCVTPRDNQLDLFSRLRNIIYLYYAPLILRVCGLSLGRTSESCFNTANSVRARPSFVASLPYISRAKKQKWATRQLPMSATPTGSDV